jgi:hypothetical protein
MSSVKINPLLWMVGCVALGVWLGQNLTAESVDSPSYPSAPEVNALLNSLEGQAPQVIGPVAKVEIEDNQIAFVARVDTGAHRCSLHTSEWEVQDASPSMVENVGKQIRFRVENHRGESQWFERTIAAVSLVRTSEQEEMRYLVSLTLNVDGIEREVLVSLNDRSEMIYPMLLGRNYLSGEFVVDVSAADRGARLLAQNR